MSDENKDEFEHNDGLGDLLREREKLEFSWSKTIVVICSLFSIVTIGIYFVFNVGKNVIESEVKENIISKSTIVESKRSYVNSVKQNDQTAKPSSSIKNLSSKSISNPGSKTSNKINSKKSTAKSNSTKISQTLSKNKASSNSKKSSKSYVAKSQSKNKQSTYSSTGNSKTTNTKTSSRVKAKRNVSVYKFKVITGTFSNQKNAISHLNSLKTQGIKGFIKQTKTSLGNYFRVQVGAYKTQEKALQQQIKLKNINIDSYIYQE